MMKSRIYMTALALLYNCHGLPTPYESSDTLQRVFGNNRHPYSTEQSGLAVSKTHRGLPVEVSSQILSQYIESGQANALRQHKDDGGWDYYIDIEFGNPPQSFRAAIDIGWSDTFVPSVSCVDPDCAGHRQYNNTRSSSYRRNGTAVRMHYSGFYTSGYAAIDTLRIADLTIDDQAFEEATEMKAVPLWDDVIDSVLGLPRLQVDDEESSLRAKSPFHNMISQGLLQKNLFSLKLSERDCGERGELLFGDINPDLFDGMLTSFPVSAIYSVDEIANAYLRPGWQVHANSVAYGYKDSEIANFSLAGYVATFSTLFPYISLPREIGKNIIQYLGADVLHRVECDRRGSLPDLVISLGHAGVPFVLKPSDYIRKNPQWHWSTTCQVEIALHDEPEDGVKYIILGSAFIARWYSVFDYDKAQISLASLKRT
ncbi:Vacuolar protease A [Trapelia coarctata]|nr:Vacuolar protease A [Trapelia coarctata]